ncbi:hypothetical protein JNUCC1_01315 [Lentibacillus sp. JNUCC-1]|nr:hypothetical protein [Lentibacillus sp. JNUCC-1]
MQEERVDVKTPEYVSLNFSLAGLGSRAAALIIDQILISIVMLAFMLIFFFAMGADLVGDSLWPFAVLIIVVFILNYGYYFVAEYFFAGRTIGKRLMGIRVIQENGHSITLLSSLIRNLVRIVDMLPQGYFIGMLMVFLHPKHKRLGDLAAGTIVVHERKVKKKASSALETEISMRQLTKDSTLIAGANLSALGQKEWNLLKTYVHRLPQLDPSTRVSMTRQLASAIFPKANLAVGTKTNKQLEDILIVLYLNLRDEWEYEL